MQQCFFAILGFFFRYSTFGTWTYPGSRFSCNIVCAHHCQCSDSECYCWFLRFFGKSTVCQEGLSILLVIGHTLLVTEGNFMVQEGRCQLKFTLANHCTLNIFILWLDQHIQMSHQLSHECWLSFGHCWLTHGRWLFNAVDPVMVSSAMFDSLTATWVVCGH